MIDRSGSEASGVRAESQGGDTLTVVAEDLGRDGGEKRVVNGDSGVGRGGGDETVGLVVPHDGAEGGAAILGGVDLPEFERPGFHGGCFQNGKSEWE